MLNTSWIRFHWTKSFFLCKNLQCDSSVSLSEAVISSALFMKMITALLTRQRSLLRTVQTVTMKPPSSVFCLSDPRPHLLPDSQQLLIQTNRIITPPPFIQLHSPFFLFNKQITNVFVALWTFNFLKPIILWKRPALKPFIDVCWQHGDGRAQVERQAAAWNQRNTYY